MGNNTFSSLFIFSRHSTRKPASVVCEDEQRDQVYFVGPPHLTLEKLGRGFEKNEGEWTGKVEISIEEIPGSWRNANVGQLPLDAMQWCSVMHP